MEDVAQAVVRDLPALGEGWDDRPLRPCLDEAVEELHARLDVRPRDRALRIEVVGQEARRDPQPLSRHARLGRRPVLEGALVRLVRLGETERGVERESELEEDERDLLPLAPPLEQRQQVAVVLDRLVERVLETRLVPGAQEVAGGLLLVLGPQPVIREQAEHLGVALRVPLLEPLRGAPMQLRALLGEERPVRRLLDERVAEAVLRLRPAAALAQEAEALQLVEGVERHFSQYAFEQRQREGAPQRGRRGDEVASPCREPVETSEDRLLYGRRHLDLDGMVEAPAVVCADERSDVRERADELLEEERVPVGRLQHAPLELGGQCRRRDERGEQLAVGVPERAEVDLAQQVRELAARVLAQPPRRVVALRPQREHEQHRRLLGEREELLEQQHRGRAAQWRSSSASTSGADSASRAKSWPTTSNVRHCSASGESCDVRASASCSSSTSSRPPRYG